MLHRPVELAGDIGSFSVAATSNLLILESWLGGLDSNQDNQSQSLMYCRLYDLPAEGEIKEMGRGEPGTFPSVTTQSNTLDRK